MGVPRSVSALALFASAFAGADAIAQDVPTDADAMRRMLDEANAAARAIDDRTRAAREKGNLLSELEALRALEGELFAKGGPARQMLADMLSIASARAGNVADALRYSDLGADPEGAAASVPASAPAIPASAARTLEGYEPVDALAAVAEEARDRRLVLVNEAHHVPQHRAFTLRLLHLLRARGFTHFAAETLYASDRGLAERGCPTAASGAYVVEPLYGDLVRTALTLGFRVVAYESEEFGRGVDREHEQAKNLFERVLRDAPEARLVVHAGYGHVNETGTVAGRPTMAQQLRDLSGIDPLTVDQTVMTEHGGPAREHPVYRFAAEHHAFSEPTVFRRKGALWSARRGAHDVTVFSPRTVLRRGRPEWLRLGGLRVEVEIPGSLVPPRRRLLVRAQRASEPANAVPVDQVEIRAGADVPVLWLPPGEHRLVSEDASGVEVARADVRVAATGSAKAR